LYLLQKYPVFFQSWKLNSFISASDCSKLFVGASLIIASLSLTRAANHGHNTFHLRNTKIHYKMELPSPHVQTNSNY